MDEFAKNTREMQGVVWQASNFVAIYVHFVRDCLSELLNWHVGHFITYL